MIKLILLLFIALIIVAVKFLPWWALIIAAVVAIIGFKYFVRYLFLMPFKMKGAALHGATLTVHSIAPATKPVKDAKKTADGEAAQEDSDDAADETSALPREYYTAEITIAPKPGAGGKFTHWEPGELLLSTPGKNPMDDSDSEDVGEVHSLEVFENGAYKTDEGMKYPDAQRLRMLLAVQPALKDVQLNYYFETLGTLKLK